MREGKWGGVCESLWACFLFFSPVYGVLALESGAVCGTTILWFGMGERGVEACTGSRLLLKGCVYFAPNTRGWI